MQKLQSIKHEKSRLKESNLMKAKFNAKTAIIALEKDDGTIIDTRNVDEKVINLIAYISALNTMNDYEP